MRGAIDNGVPGIDADCGGECSCATCHVIVADEWMGAVGPPGEAEESMLDLNPEREANSRLSCQIEVHRRLGRPSGESAGIPDVAFGKRPRLASRGYASRPFN